MMDIQTQQNYIHTRTGMTADAFKRAFLDNLYYVQGKDMPRATPMDHYLALAYTVRDRLMQRWLQTFQTYDETDCKFVYYLSAEYLLGPQLPSNLLNIGLMDVARQAMTELGLDLDAVMGQEREPGLGNGGLGRLAACYLASMATLGLPAIGYGIRYEYGIFRQTFVDGWQVERPDDWTAGGDPWSFPRPERRVEIGFGGYTEKEWGSYGDFKVHWRPAWCVEAIPYNMMVPGYKNNTVNSLRLWSAHATASFDLQVFNTGDFVRAVEGKVHSENITKVLYPDDTTPQGKLLRLQQQYFFVAASLADIVRVFMRRNGANWDLFPDKVAIQLNDTHPTIAIPELMRLLVDEYDVDWDTAWSITSRTFAYTNHTLLPEALEEWPASLLEQLLPRHMEIIREINRRFLEQACAVLGDYAAAARMSIVTPGAAPHVRMAYLASVGSFSINGVSALQSGLLRDLVLRDFNTLWPWKFNNKTNGVDPRLFIRLANPRLSSLIYDRIGEHWLGRLERLRELEQFIDDPTFRAEWREVKQANKRDAAEKAKEGLGLEIDPNAVWDVMVKRLHEYKRQLLKAFHIITLYNRIKANPTAEVFPRVFVFGAKAAPGYRMAKLIIKLLNSIAEVINNDPAVGDRLKVVFVPNFNVSTAMQIYPAADISEQISLAGKEASGTGNMKFALNGAVTVGTLDGANIEIRDLVGPENFFLFGLRAEDVFHLLRQGYRPAMYYERDPELRQVVDMIASGYFSRGDREVFRPLIDSLLSHDQYFIMADYAAYVEAVEAATLAYQDTERWTRMSILNTARTGFFSADRAVQQYSEGIWKTQPVPITL
ncbi:MAG: glycogen/starch/alpha-glucan phosphorylase [Anaerolineae bacterium]